MSTWLHGSRALQTAESRGGTRCRRCRGERPEPDYSRTCRTGGTRLTGAIAGSRRPGWQFVSATWAPAGRGDSRHGNSTSDTAGEASIGDAMGEEACSASGPPPPPRSVGISRPASSRGSQATARARLAHRRPARSRRALVFTGDAHGPQPPSAEQARRRRQELESHAPPADGLSAGELVRRPETTALRTAQRTRE